MNLKQALSTLDPNNDDHWTTDGLPRVDAASRAFDREVKRQDITDAMPSLTRETFASEFPPIGHEPKPDPTPPAEPEPEPTTPPAEPEQPESVPTPEPETEPAREEPVEPGGPGVEPEEDPQQVAHVVPHDDVVGMGSKEVYNDIDLVDRAIVEFGRQAAILSARQEVVKARLAEVGQRSAMLARARNMLLRRGARPTTVTPIQDYLKTQQEARQKRAERAQQFIKAGTTAEDVVAQLEGPSKIDSAMKRRRNRGTQRPAYPVKTGS